MKYNIISKDHEYLQKLEEFYKKYYKNKIDIIFNQDIEEGRYLISSKNDEEADLYFGMENDIIAKKINKYQKADDFFEFLISLEDVDFKNKKGFKVISLLNGVTSAGSTTIGLNLADLLSKKGRTIYLSFEKNPSLYFYLEKKINISLNDFIFYINQDRSVIENKLLNLESNLVVIDQSEIFDDIKNIEIDMINKILELIRHTGFNYLILDFDTLYDQFKSFEGEKYIIINHSLNNYSRLFFHKDYINNGMALIVNNRDREMYINESMLRIVDKFYYIDRDYECYKDDKKWKSTIIQTQLTEILKN